jgi:CDP-diglyceride synthetase
MKTNNRRSFFSGIPSWASALLAMIIITIVLFILAERWSEEISSGDSIAYILLGVLHAVCCFLIVRKDPKSIWYVPLIINAALIIFAFLELIGEKEWLFKDWLFICGIWVLSIIASIIGRWIGRRTATVLSQG